MSGYEKTYILQMCQIPLFRIKNSFTASYFVKYHSSVRRKVLLFPFNVELQTVVISLAFVKTTDSSGEKRRGWQR